jgi:hypothetical protein
MIRIIANKQTRNTAISMTDAIIKFATDVKSKVSPSPAMSNVFASPSPMDISSLLLKRSV